MMDVKLAMLLPGGDVQQGVHLPERFNLSDVVEDEFSLGELSAFDSEEVDAFERACGCSVVLSRET